MTPVSRYTSGILVVLEAVVLLVVLSWAQGWLLQQVTYVRWIRPRYRRRG